MAYLISAPLFSEKFGFSVIAFFISFPFRMQMGISRIWDLGKTLLLLSHRANENTRAYTTRTKTNTTVCTPLLPFWGIKRSQFCLALLHGGERVYSFYFPPRSTTNISVENSSTQMSFSFTHTHKQAPTHDSSRRNNNFHCTRKCSPTVVASIVDTKLHSEIMQQNNRMARCDCRFSPPDRKGVDK